MGYKSEHDLQVSCVNWFRLQYPHEIIYAIANGGDRNIITATRLKAEGVVSGIPDLHIPCMRKGFGGLYIEMKNGRKGRVSDSQKEIMNHLAERGYKCYICRTFEEFVEAVNSYMI